MDSHRIDKKIRKYTLKLKSAHNIREAEMYQNHLKKYYKMKQYGGQNDKPEQKQEQKQEQKEQEQKEQEQKYQEQKQEQNIPDKTQNVEIVKTILNNKLEELDKMIKNLSGQTGIDTSGIVNDLKNITAKINNLKEVSKLNKDIANAYVDYDLKMSQKLKNISVGKLDLGNVTEEINSMKEQTEKLSDILGFDIEAYDTYYKFDLKIKEIKNEKDTEKAKELYKQFIKEYNEALQNKKIKPPYAEYLTNDLKVILSK